MKEYFSNRNEQLLKKLFEKQGIKFRIKENRNSWDITADYDMVKIRTPEGDEFDIAGMVDAESVAYHISGGDEQLAKKIEKQLLGDEEFIAAAKKANIQAQEYSDEHGSALEELDVAKMTAWQAHVTDEGERRSIEEEFKRVVQEEWTMAGNEPLTEERLDEALNEFTGNPFGAMKGNASAKTPEELADMVGKLGRDEKYVEDFIKKNMSGWANNNQRVKLLADFYDALDKKEQAQVVAQAQQTDSKKDDEELAKKMKQAAQGEEGEKEGADTEVPADMEKGQAFIAKTRKGEKTVQVVGTNPDAMGGPAAIVVPIDKDSCDAKGSKFATKATNLKQSYDKCDAKPEAPGSDLTPLQNLTTGPMNLKKVLSGAGLSAPFIKKLLPIVKAQLAAAGQVRAKKTTNDRLKQLAKDQAGAVRESKKSSRKIIIEVNQAPQPYGVSNRAGGNRARGKAAKKGAAASADKQWGATPKQPDVARVQKALTKSPALIAALDKINNKAEVLEFLLMVSKIAIEKTSPDAVLTAIRSLPSVMKKQQAAGGEAGAGKKVPMPPELKDTFNLSGIKDYINNSDFGDDNENRDVAIGAIENWVAKFEKKKGFNVSEEINKLISGTIRHMMESSGVIKPAPEDEGEEPDTMELDDTEEFEIDGEKLEEEKNPYAICTASVGREDEKKYKSCKDKVAAQNKK